MKAWAERVLDSNAPTSRFSAGAVPLLYNICASAHLPGLWHRPGQSLDRKSINQLHWFIGSLNCLQVPISLVYRTDLAKLDGSDPLLLDAYGRWAHRPAGGPSRAALLWLVCTFGPFSARQPAAGLISPPGAPVHLPAATKQPTTQTSAPPACPSSTEASPLPSRTCAAAARWGGAGTRTEST